MRWGGWVWDDLGKFFDDEKFLSVIKILFTFSQVRGNQVWAVMDPNVHHSINKIFNILVVNLMTHLHISPRNPQKVTSLKEGYWNQEQLYHKFFKRNIYKKLDCIQSMHIFPVNICGFRGNFPFAYHQWHLFLMCWIKAFASSQFHGSIIKTRNLVKANKALPHIFSN